MSMKIENKKENELLSRIEVTARIDFEKSTPKTDDVKDQLAKAMSTDVSNIALKKIATVYGKREAEVTAYVYKSSDLLKKIEPKKKEKKVLGAAEAA